MAGVGGADDRAGLAARPDPAPGGAGDLVRIPAGSQPEALASQGHHDPGLTVGEARVRRARLIVIAATVAGCAAILLMSRGFNFYFDEWDFILAAPDWTWLSYLQPHNEHPSMIPKLIYNPAEHGRAAHLCPLHGRAPAAARSQRGAGFRA